MSFGLNVSTPPLNEWNYGVAVIVTDTIDIAYDVSGSEMEGQEYVIVSSILTSISLRAGLN